MPRTGRPRKLISGAMVILLLIASGAIVNVAVAWGCVYRIQQQDWITRLTSEVPLSICYEGELSTQSHNLGMMNAWRTSQIMNATWGCPIEILSKSEFDDRLPKWSALKDSCPPSGDRRMYGSTAAAVSLSEVGAGWPAIALHGASIHEEFPIPGVRVGLLALPLKQSNGREEVIVPYWPLWPGFAINTFFYAAVLWTMFAIPSVMRRNFRRRRIKRNLCPACAYPIGISPVCTECGTAVVKVEPG